ncbi:MAG: energy transducer TonB [Desulfovibrionales bacterium]
MRFASIFLSVLVHVAVVLGVTFSGQFSSKTIRADLDRPVYQVNLVQKAAPVTLSKMPAMQKVAPAKPVAQKMKPISPVKVAPKKEAKPVATKEEPEKPPEKKQPTREEIMAEAMKSAQQTAGEEKASKQAQEEEALRQALSEIQKEVGNLPSGSSQGGSGQGGLASIYEAIVIETVKQNWRFPVVGSSQNLQARVEIRLGPGGEITGSRLLSRSGREDFDASVLRAIEETGEFPPPPKNISKVDATFNLDEMIQ